MILFDNKAFTLSPDMVYETISTPMCKISVIDNFYKDFDKVYNEIEKLPIALTEYNCDDMLDGRKSYLQTMFGTELPYIGEYGPKLKEIIDLKSYRDIIIEPSVIVNVNQPLTDKYKDHYFNIHKDTKYPNSIGTLVFLNKSYEEGEGFNTYTSMKDGFEMFARKDTTDVNYFFQAKPNRAVVFSTDLNHGACIATEQFTKEPRYTQIIFPAL